MLETPPAVGEEESCIFAVLRTNGHPPMSFIKISRKTVLQYNLSTINLFHTIIIPTIIPLIDRNTNVKPKDIYKSRRLWNCCNYKEVALDIALVIGEGFRWRCVLKHLVAIDPDKNVARWYHKEMPFVWRHIDEMAATWGWTLNNTAHMMVPYFLWIGSFEEAKTWFLIWKGDDDTRKVEVDVITFYKAFTRFYDKNNENAMRWLVNHTLITYNKPVCMRLNKRRIQVLEDIKIGCSDGIRGAVEQVLLDLKNAEQKRQFLYNYLV
jgi:hypothetical protein